jgi:hypothetical protein
MCGACHDIVVPHAFGADGGSSDPDAGTPIERTFAEWQASAFSGPGGGTCNNSSCHMVQRPYKQLISVVGAAPKRYFHQHDFPAIDVQLTPGADAAAPVPPGVAFLLSNALQGALCRTQAGGIRVILDGVNIGHNFPSGAAQDRRFWAQVVGYQGSTVTYQSGMVPIGAPTFDPQKDPDLWLLRDCIFGTDGGEVNMFWNAASYEGNELPPLASLSPTMPSVGQRMQFFPRDHSPLPPSQVPDRITLNLWVQPIGSDVLNDLVSSGDLDPSVAASMPVLPVPLNVILPDSGIPANAPLVWTAQDAVNSGLSIFAQITGDGTTATCVGSLPAAGPRPAMNHTRCTP